MKLTYSESIHYKKTYSESIKHNLFNKMKGSPEKRQREKLAIERAGFFT
jgi:hypothetical protein